MPRVQAEPRARVYALRLRTVSVSRSMTTGHPARRQWHRARPSWPAPARAVARRRLAGPARSVHRPSRNESTRPSSVWEAFASSARATNPTRRTVPQIPPFNNDSVSGQIPAMPPASARPSGIGFQPWQLLGVCLREPRLLPHQAMCFLVARRLGRLVLPMRLEPCPEPSTPRLTLARHHHLPWQHLDSAERGQGAARRPQRSAACRASTERARTATGIGSGMLRRKRPEVPFGLTVPPAMA